MDRRELILRKALEKYAASGTVRQRAEGKGWATPPPSMRVPEEERAAKRRQWAARSLRRDPGLRDKGLYSTDWTYSSPARYKDKPGVPVRERELPEGEFISESRSAKELEKLRDRKKNNGNISNPGYEPYRAPGQVQIGVPALAGATGIAGSVGAGTVKGGALGTWLGYTAAPSVGAGATYVGLKGVDLYEALADIGRRSDWMSHVADKIEPEVWEWINSPEGQRAVRQEVVQIGSQSDEPFNLTNEDQRERFNQLRAQVINKVYRDELSRRLKNEMGGWRHLATGPAKRRQTRYMERTERASQLAQEESESYLKRLASPDISQEDYAEQKTQYYLNNAAHQVLGNVRKLLRDRPATPDRIYRQVFNEAGQHAEQLGETDEEKERFRKIITNTVAGFLNRAGENE